MVSQFALLVVVWVECGALSLEVGRAWHVELAQVLGQCLLLGCASAAQIISSPQSAAVLVLYKYSSATRTVQLRPNFKTQTLPGLKTSTPDSNPLRRPREAIVTLQSSTGFMLRCWIKRASWLQSLNQRTGEEVSKKLCWSTVLFIYWADPPIDLMIYLFDTV